MKQEEEVRPACLIANFRLMHVTLNCFPTNNDISINKSLFWSWTSYQILHTWVLSLTHPLKKKNSVLLNQFFQWKLFLSHPVCFVYKVQGRWEDHFRDHEKNSVQVALVTGLLYHFDHTSKVEGASTTPPTWAASLIMVPYLKQKNFPNSFAYSWKFSDANLQS